MALRDQYWLRSLKTNFSAQKRFICPRKREGNKGKERKGEGRGGRNICPRGAKDCLWIGRRGTWPIGKWTFIKVKGDVRMKSLVFIGHVN